MDTLFNRLEIKLGNNVSISMDDNIYIHPFEKYNEILITINKYQVILDNFDISLTTDVMLIIKEELIKAGIWE